MGHRLVHVPDAIGGYIQIVAPFEYRVEQMAHVMKTGPKPAANEVHVGAAFVPGLVGELQEGFDKAPRVVPHPPTGVLALENADVEGNPRAGRRGKLVGDER